MIIAVLGDLALDLLPDDSVVKRESSMAERHSDFYQSYHQHHRLGLLCAAILGTADTQAVPNQQASRN